MPDVNFLAVQDIFLQLVLIIQLLNVTDLTTLAQ